MSARNKYSIVIPVFNSTASLKELVLRLETVFKDIIKQEYEIIMVDDSSPNPATWRTMLRLYEEHANLTVINLMRNFGRHGALMCGLQYVTGQYVIIVDDDLQHKPEDIPLLLEKKNHDVVFGAFTKKHHSIFKRIASYIKGWFDYKIAGKPRHIAVSSFMLLKTEISKAILAIRTANPFLPALIFYITKDIVNVPVDHCPRKYGKSGFTFIKMIKSFSNLIFSNSSFLLRLIAQIGLIFSAMSFMTGFYIILEKLVEHISVPGWASLMIVTSLQGGLILLALGVIGEYLIRAINGIETRPPFIVRTVKSSLSKNKNILSTNSTFDIIN